MTAAGFAGTTIAVPPGAVWTKACVALKNELGEGAFGSWVAQAALRECRGGALVLVTQTGIARDWIRRNAWRRIAELWAQHDPQGRAIELKSRFGLAAPDPAQAIPGPAAAPSFAKAESAAVPAPVEPKRPAGLQDRFSLDSFV